MSTMTMSLKGIGFVVSHIAYKEEGEGCRTWIQYIEVFYWGFDLIEKQNQDKLIGRYECVTSPKPMNGYGSLNQAISVKRPRCNQLVG